MFVTVVAIMCQLMVENRTIAADRECTAEEQAIEEIVTDTEKDPRIDFMSCQIGHQIGVSDWKMHHPIYFKNSWRVARVRCAAGHYTPKHSV